MKTNLPAITPKNMTVTQNSIKFCFNVTSFAEITDISYLIYNESDPTTPVSQGSVEITGYFWPYGQEIKITKSDLEYNSGTYVCEFSATNTNGTTRSSQSGTLLQYIDWAEPESVISGNRFIANGQEEVGTFPEKNSSDITVFRGTVMVPKGAFTENASVEVETYGADYLCFTAYKANSSVALQTRAGQENEVTLYVSNDRSEWSEWDGSAITLATPGDSVWIYGENNTTMNGKQFVMTGTVNGTGDLLTLIDKDAEVETLPAHCFDGLFENCTALVSFEYLPGLTSEYCYNDLFKGCSNLATAPVMPAATLSDYCYRNMFENCIRLVSLPTLPATVMATGCYQGMFSGCTRLNQVVELPATDLASSCYANMFENCTALVSAPSLPATTLASNCYNSMFKGCIALYWTPNLPSKIDQPVGGCYSHMFQNCILVNKVVIGADFWSGVAEGWLDGVSETGTVLCTGNATLPTNSTSGIPSGWNRQVPMEFSGINFVFKNDGSIYSATASCTENYTGAAIWQKFENGERLSIKMIGNGGTALSLDPSFPNEISSGFRTAGTGTCNVSYTPTGGITQTYGPVTWTGTEYAVQDFTISGGSIAYEGAYVMHDRQTYNTPSTMTFSGSISPELKSELDAGGEMFGWNINVYEGNGSGQATGDPLWNVANYDIDDASNFTVTAQSGSMMAMPIEEIPEYVFQIEVMGQVKATAVCAIPVVKVQNVNLAWDPWGGMMGGGAWKVSGQFVVASDQWINPHIRIQWDAGEGRINTAEFQADGYVEADGTFGQYGGVSTQESWEPVGDTIQIYFVDNQDRATLFNTVTYTKTYPYGQ